MWSHILVVHIIHVNNPSLRWELSTWDATSISDWPEQWFLNLSMDLVWKELNNLLLLLACRQSPPPPLHTCYHAYMRWNDDGKAFQNELQQIPMDTFCLLDSINAFIPS
ncbi:hypothetical protein EDC04DRAFT_2613122 [Pisolithus marmoratus]|nr:hypothetical protein EDC04DRAFT_2613122 [Pisolithus marmoratus]